MDVVVAGVRFFFLGARFFLLASFAYFCALSVNLGIVTQFALPPTVPDRSNVFSVPTPATKPPLSSYAVIYTRDIFNATKASPPTQGTALASSPGNANIRLLGTATSLHGRAFAIIEDQSTRTQGLYREGDLIAPGVLLVKVGWDRITIERRGQRETLVLPKDPAPPSSPPPVTQIATLTPSNTNPGVQQITPDVYHIDRREVDHAINNLSDLFTQVRAVPYSPQDGVVQGFRLSQIRPESLIDRIGLKNGDIVQRVNGVEIVDPSTAFQLLQDLQGHSQIRVDVLRNHQPTTLSYEIR